MKFVQFTDNTDTVIKCAFGGPQNTNDWPNQGTVADDDARWTSFIAPPILPNSDGFLQACKTGLGGIVAITLTNLPYPAFFFAVQGAHWADAQALLIAAHTATLLTDAQFNAIKAFAVTYNIPITL